MSDHAHDTEVRRIALRMVIASIDRDQEAMAVAYADAVGLCLHWVVTCLVGLAQAKVIEADGGPEEAKAWAQGLLLHLAE